MKTICIWSACGGVGKTTTTVNIADWVYRNGYNVLTIDLDPQDGSLSQFAEMEFNTSVIDILKDNSSVEDAIISGEQSFDILPSTKRLDTFESYIQTENITMGEFILENKLQTVSEIYDYVFIDTPATLNTLVDNALIASDNIMIPMEMTKKGKQSITEVESTISALESQLQKARPEFTLDILGVVPNMVENNTIADTIHSELASDIETPIFDVEIPDYTVMQRSWSKKQTIFQYHDDTGLKPYEETILDAYEQIGQELTRETDLTQESEIEVTINE